MTSYADLVLADGACDYWPCTEASGAAAADAGPDAHGLALVGSGTFGQPGGPAGGTALALANAGYLASGAARTLPDGSAFTMESWVKLGSDPGNLAHFLAYAAPGFAGHWVAASYCNGPATTKMFLLDTDQADDDGYFYEGLVDGDHTPLIGGAWHHLAVVYDGLALHFYVDGAPKTPVLQGGPLDGYAASPLLYVGRAWYGNSFTGSVQHVAFYPLALSACQVLSHYDLATTGAYTPCFTWLRLTHAGGQGYWQSRGDVTEEWAGGVRRLRLPFATLGATPPLLMGRDAATNLPAFCPPPTVSVQNNTTIYQVNPPANTPAPVVGPTPQEVACGIALYCAGDLVVAYGVLAALITSIFHNGLSAAADFLTNGQLNKSVGELGETAMTAEASTIWGALAEHLVGAFVDYELGPLSPQAIVNAQKALWDVMNAQAAGMPPALQFEFTAATQSAWIANIDAHNGAFTVAQHYALTFLINYYQPQFWQDDMLVGAQNHFDTCPLLEYT